MDQNIVASFLATSSKLIPASYHLQLLHFRCTQTGPGGGGVKLIFCLQINKSFLQVGFCCSQASPKYPCQNNKFTISL